MHINYFGDDTAETYLRVRIDNNRGYLDKIYVNENMRGKHIATDLVDLAIDRLFPHIQIWNISRVYPSVEARNFWDSIIARYHKKTFIEFID